MIAFLFVFSVGDLTAQQNQRWKVVATEDDYERESILLRRDTESLRSLGMLVLGILLISVLSAYKRFRRTSQISSEVVKQLQDKRQHLLKELASLDEQHAHEKSWEHACLTERKRLKQELVELTVLCKIPS